MTKLSHDTLIERETIIRWDESEPVATLWTASPKVRKVWESYGFPITVTEGGGWRSTVPVDRISYRTYKGVAADKSRKEP